MSPMLHWIIALTVTAIALAIWQRSLVPKHIRSRANLRMDEIYRQYYADSNIPQQAVEEAFTLVAQYVGVKRGRLRPADRFDDELKMPKGWEGCDSGLAELLEDLEVMVPNTEHVRTVDDVVRLIAN